MSERYPASLQSERFVLGTALAYSDRMAELRGDLLPEDFSLEQHAVIWRAACALFDSGHTADLVTVSERLHAEGRLKSAGGASYIVSLSEGMPQTVNLEAWVRLVRDKTFLRRVAMASENLMQRCLLQNDSPEEIAAYAHGLLAELQPVGTKAEFLTLAEATERYGMDAILHPKRGVDTIAYPLPWLDRKTGGMAREQLIFIGGRTSQGKTSLATQCAATSAASGFRTVMFSLEMNLQDLYRKIVAQKSGVDEWRIRENQTSPQEREQVQSAYAQVLELPLHVMDTGSRNLSQIASALRRFSTRHGSPGLVIIDHLHSLAAVNAAEDRTQQVSADARNLKLLAREFKCPFLVPCQLNNATARNNAKPTLADLRQSGEIAENADVVLFVWLDIADKTADVQKGELVIGKQRMGQRDIGKKMHFDKGTQVWSEAYGED